MSTIDDTQAGAFAPDFRRGAEHFVGQYPNESYRIALSKSQAGLFLTVGGGGRLRSARHVTLNPVLNGEMARSVFEALEQIRSQAD
jgi:hypothetical protein